MTSLTERVPLDRIERRARQAHPGTVLLAVIASALLGLGWVAYKFCAVAWFVFVWCGSAVAEGWISARAGRRAP